MEAYWGAWQAIYIVSPGTSFHIHHPTPVAAVIIEACTCRQRDNAIGEQWVASIEPDWCMGATVVLLDAKGGHGIAGHTGEAVPLTSDMPVTQGHTSRVVDMVVSIPPGLIQTDVGWAGIWS